MLAKTEAYPSGASSGVFFLPYPQILERFENK
jgi:hypothetical protein